VSDPTGERSTQSFGVDDLQMADELHHGDDDTVCVSPEDCPAASKDRDVRFTGRRGP
jgi:hypothetical protein